MTNLEEWITQKEKRLKSTDLAFLDKQITGLLETSEVIESLVFQYPRAVVLVKLADLKVQMVLVDTSDTSVLVALAGRMDNWHDQYGVRAYSLKQAYDKQGFLVSPLDPSRYNPSSLPYPSYVEQWSWSVPLSMNQLPVEVIDLT